MSTQKKILNEGRKKKYNLAFNRPEDDPFRLLYIFQLLKSLCTNRNTYKVKLPGLAQSLVNFILSAASDGTHFKIGENKNREKIFNDDFYWFHW